MYSIEIQKQLHQISCVFEGSDNKGAIYLSGIIGAKNITLLKKYNITAVLSAARNGHVQYEIMDEENDTELNKKLEQKFILNDYMHIYADDHQNYNLYEHFQAAFQFIDKNLKSGNVLVHCMAGVSRSASLIISYLIKKYDYSVDMIINMLRRKRSIVNPNNGFLKQLRKFQMQCRVNKHIEEGLQKIKKKQGNLNKYLFTNCQQVIFVCDGVIIPSFEDKYQKINSQNKSQQQKQPKEQSIEDHLEKNTSLKQIRNEFIKKQFQDQQLKKIIKQQNQIIKQAQNQQQKQNQKKLQIQFQILEKCQIKQKYSHKQNKEIINSAKYIYFQKLLTKDQQQQKILTQKIIKSDQIIIQSPQSVINSSLAHKIQSLKLNLLQQYKKSNQKNFNQSSLVTQIQKNQFKFSSQITAKLLKQNQYKKRCSHERHKSKYQFQLQSKNNISNSHNQDENKMKV